MNETCLICGEIIPEGRQVCPTCEQRCREGFTYDPIYYEFKEYVPTSIKQLISKWLEIEGDFTDDDIVKYTNDPSKSQLVKDLILMLQKADKLEEVKKSII